MSDNFTYEEKNTTRPLETYEWDNTWWDHAGEKTDNRILYIGDSISCGVREAIREMPEVEFYFDGFGTSRGIDNPYFKDALSLFMKQEGERNLALFNNGLHGWHLSTEEYKEYYEDMINFLLAEFGETPLILINSTTVQDEEREALVIERNKAVGEIADKYQLPLIDLYSVSKKLTWRDGVHFVAEDNHKLAQAVLESIKKV